MCRFTFVAETPRQIPDKIFFFFFQAEDGIRDVAVTGVQTCALPISTANRPTNRETDRSRRLPGGMSSCGRSCYRRSAEIGRASCREKSVDLGGRRIIKKKKKKHTRRQERIEKQTQTQHGPISASERC